MTALAVAACTGAPEVPATPSARPGTATASEQVGGGTFRWGITEPTAITPPMAATADDRAVVDALFDSLTAWDDAGRAVPAAAASWEAGEGATRWTFALRDGATFHDGTPVDADAFARAWAQLVAEGPAGYLLEDVVGHGAVARGEVAALAGVRTPDARTIEILLARPRADLPVLLGHPALGPVAPAAEGAPVDPDLPVGNGPFRMTEAWAHDDFIRAARWDGWRNGDRAANGIAEVLFRIADLDINFLAFTQGRRDLAQVPADALGLAEERYGPSGGAWDGPGLIVGGRPETYVLGIDRSVPPFGDREVREAVSLAADRVRLAAELEGGNLDPATSLLPPALPGARPDVCAHCTSNPRGAEARFEAAGVRQLPFAFNADGGHERVRDVLRDGLSAAGVALVSNGRGAAPDLTTYQARLADGGLGLFRLPLVADVPSGLAVLLPLLHGDRTPDRGGLNAMGYADPQVDALLDQAARTLDDRAREALLRRVEDIALNRDVVVVPLFTTRHAVVAAEDVRGLRYGPHGLVDLTRIVLDR